MAHESLDVLAELAKKKLGDLSKYETMIGCGRSQASTAHERRACMLCDATVYVHPTSLATSAPPHLVVCFEPCAQVVASLSPPGEEPVVHIPAAVYALFREQHPSLSHAALVKWATKHLHQLKQRTQPWRAAVLAEDCTHCEAKALQPCTNLGAVGEPMPQGYEFHGQRTHAALRKRDVAAASAALADSDD